MQRWRNVRGSQKAQASGREWMLGILKGNSGNGFLKQTCGLHNLYLRTFYNVVHGCPKVVILVQPRPL